MRIYKISFFSVLLFLLACSSEDVPSDIIKPKEMTSLLTEVHILDGSLYNVVPVADTLYKYGTARYLALFKKFHTDSTQFRKSFKFYAMHPAMLVPIYDQVAVNLKNKTDSVNKIQQKQFNAPKPDTAKKKPQPSTTPVLKSDTAKVITHKANTAITKAELQNKLKSKPKRN